MRTTDNTDTQGIQYSGGEVSYSSHGQGLLTITFSLPGFLRMAGERERESSTPECTDVDLLTIPPCWALSPPEWHAHAVDAWADHPLGVWIARCGHQLSGSTPLYDVPQGQRCAGCAKWSQATEPRTTTASGR